MKLWDVATGTLIRTFQNDNEVNAVAFSPDGCFALSRSATIALWDIATGEKIRTFEASGIFSVDGQYVLSGAKLWDVSAAREVGTFEGNISAAAFAADGRLAFSNGESIELWEIKSNKLIKKLSHTGEIQAMALAAGGDRIVTCGKDNALKVWDTAT